MHRSPLAIALVVVLLVLLSVGLAAWQFVSIKSTGIPLGPAMRLPNHVVQIIRTTERYLPTLHRNPDKDRYRLDLLVVSVADPSQQEMITLTRQQNRNALQPMTKALGAEGDVVWVQALELLAVNLKTRRVIRSEEFRRANPELAVFLASARFEFTNQLVAVSPDWQQAFAFAADSLRASPCPPPPRGSWINPSGTDEASISLCSGGLLGATEWFGALATNDLISSFKPGFSLPRDFAVNSKDEPRLLYRSRLEINGSRLRIVEMNRISEASYRSAALLRVAPGGELLRLNAPVSVLMLHRTGTGLAAPVTLSRIAPNGELIWTTDTGIGTLKQVLADTNVVTLIGERPPIPNKVPEPIMVFLNAATGATNSISLWR